MSSSALSVLMTADAMGGVWTYAMELASELASRGVSVALATMGDRPSEAQARRAKAIPGLTLFESDFKLEWMADPWGDVARAGAWLLDLERRLRPDVVHLNGYCHGALPFRAPVVVVGHSCVLSWWEAVKGEPAPARYDRYREDVARGLRAATRVIAPTRAMLASLERHYGVRSSGSVILNGRSFTDVAVAEKEPFVFCATRVWDEAKNVAALARAAEGSLFVYPVLVAGDAKAPGVPGESTKENKLDSVTLLGSLSHAEVMGWMARAAIFALPALYEPFGLAALEAAGAGAALVLGDIPSLREIWGDAAVLVPPRDAAALRRALVDLAGDERRRRSLAQKARARALSMTSGRMADQYARIYAELARSPVTAHSQIGERMA
jgi:glycosyltransferase involved in cell wall biosynthesis